MKRSYWIEHKGKSILFIDFSNADIEGVRQAIADAKPIIVTQPHGSVLCLVETQGTRLSLDISQVMKEFTLHNKPFMKTTALVGVDGMQRVILNAVILFTKRRNLVIKSSRQEALDFLVSQ